LIGAFGRSLSALFVVTEEVLEPTPGDRLEDVVRDDDRSHAVEAKIAEVLAKLAPSPERPRCPPIEQSERLHDARGLRLRAILIRDLHLPLSLDRLAEEGELLVLPLAEVEREERGGSDAIFQTLREDGLDFGEHVVRGVRERGIREALHYPRAEHQRLDLLL